MSVGVTILGSTGSIGTQSLDVIDQLGSPYRVAGLAAGRQWEALATQATLCGPTAVAIGDASLAEVLRERLGGSTELLVGDEGLVALAERPDSDTVIAAIVGAAGLPATLAAVAAGKRVGLANKEALVVAGSVLMPLAERSGATLLPIDSEHSAIFQALQAGRREEVHKIYLTASGGPFRTWAAEQMEEATLEDALNHPTWSMGPKITIDSATLMNKALEIIEACWLFDVEPHCVEVVVHPESIIHSMVEFRAKGNAELWDPWTGAVQPLRVLGETVTGTKVKLPLEDYEAQIVAFTPGREHANPPLRPERTVQEIVLDGEWEFELRPTMDNRFGDFRLPATDKIIGPEARIFRHAVESGDATAWQAPDYDDSHWERVTYDVGPQFWLLGPLPADKSSDSLDAELAKLARVDPQEAVNVAGKPVRWRPYDFSWRQGLEGDPGHQGYHGLKENVTDHFLCLGGRARALNETKYATEKAGSRYYLWTSATVDRPTKAHMVISTRQEGEQPHASEVLTPEIVFLNGTRVEDLQQAVSLRAGANPILVRYDKAGRGYFVLKREGKDAKPSSRTPLAMTWFDDPSLIRFDVHAGAKPAEWFRFTAPPGLRAMTVTARGTVQAWADGQPMRAAGQDRFEAATPLSGAATVALRVMPETGSCGAAIFPDPVRLECGPGVAALGDWSKMGALECYSGGAWYRKTVALTPEQTRGEIALDLGTVVATAEVRVNGQVAGIRVAPPWRVDISKQVKPGQNRIEVLVYNTLANHYLTIPTRYRGELTSGLLGPVTLEVRWRWGQLFTLDTNRNGATPCHSRLQRVKCKELTPSGPGPRRAPSG